MMYVIRRQSDGHYFTGAFDLFTPDLKKAKFYSELETEVAFLFGGEEWMPVPYSTIYVQQLRRIVWMA